MRKSLSRVKRLPEFTEDELSDLCVLLRGQGGAVVRAGKFTIRFSGKTWMFHYTGWPSPKQWMRGGAPKEIAARKAAIEAAKAEA